MGAEDALQGRRSPMRGAFGQDIDLVGALGAVFAKWLPDDYVDMNALQPLLDKYDATRRLPEPPRQTLRERAPRPPKVELSMPLAKRGHGAADPPLAGFLAECGQSAGDVPPMAEALESFSSGRLFPDFSLATCRKIGEGTYGEAFKSGETVLKIVPMGGETRINGEPQMGCAQIRAEAAVARRLAALRPERQSSKHTANVTSGFIDTKRVAVCRGPYAPELLEQWRAYDARETSENENPGEFPAEQLYAIFAFADGGTDLEHADVGTYLSLIHI